VPGNGQDVIGTGARFELRNGRFRNEASVLELAADVTERNVRRGRIRQRGKPGIEGVVQKDRSSSSDVELREGLGLGLDIAIGPRRIGRPDNRLRRRDRDKWLLVGFYDIALEEFVRQVWRVDEDDRARRQTSCGQRSRNHGAP
jgi:hypothetical protein